MQKLIVILAILSLVWTAPQDMESEDWEAMTKRYIGRPYRSPTTPPPMTNKSESGGKCEVAAGLEGVCTIYYRCNTIDSDEKTFWAQLDKCALSTDMCCLPRQILDDPYKQSEPASVQPNSSICHSVNFTKEILFLYYFNKILINYLKNHV